MVAKVKIDRINQRGGLQAVDRGGIILHGLLKGRALRQELLGLGSIIPVARRQAEGGDALVPELRLFLFSPSSSFCEGRPSFAYALAAEVDLNLK